MEPLERRKASFPKLINGSKEKFDNKGRFPAASSKSETVFTVAGNTVTPKRASFNPEKVEDLVVVKCNVELPRIMRH